MKYDITDIKNKLKENYAAFAKEYAAEVDASYRRKVQNTEPGQPAPRRGLVGLEVKAFNQRAAAYRRRAEEIINSTKEQIAADVTAAPSAEAASYISMLAGRKHINDYEIQFAVDMYGKNFSCYSALQEIAARHKIYINNHPTMDALNDVQAFEQNNKYYTLETISNPNHKPDVVAAMYAAGIDGTLAAVNVETTASEENADS